ncbi:TetR family transcriptional regulator [Paenibacillus sp. J23TS9]|uniref:TetR/AcrR family transcriptional regulator n=1 Tax=Paenibacillus sp. J23TS9 TaxID=2807193 RepID=UPI001B20E58C|nr:TetR/AcrR family transcriptional regulator [Paenibacillus sp. J23TS9]GIP30197.1 TetR family transcriptional regulator [Paenibacillus sp. J23TS9]
MSKSFTEHERQIIKQNLINACKECWKQYGYSKTGIRDIVQRANISTGAFYQFFSSKELLFVKTADEYQKELDQILYDKMKIDSSKHGLAEGLKALAIELSTMSWLTSMWDEWALIIQKLPPDYMEQDFNNDKIRMENLISEYELIPKKSLDMATQVVDCLLSSIFQFDFTVSGTKEAVDFIIDTTINELFE